ncbi:MAG: DUF4402 domain-containing protein [Bacteroidota bacterium]|nr:DUF4402 domain-containing protein [Bacteroidota bacterium]MDP4235476.1 DUF4402 domain-containing protein [Bacteroidota bacterium]
MFAQYSESKNPAFDAIISTSDLASTDFTFEISELALLRSMGTAHSIKCLRLKDLDFGRAFCGISAGTVVIDPNSATPRKSTGGVILDNRNTGHPANILLTIYNEKHCKNNDHSSNDDDESGRSEDDDAKTNDNRTGFQRHGVWNSIALPSSSALSMTLNGTLYTMTVDSYTFIRTKGNFSIGATLHVKANQTAGAYSGNFTITQMCD